jgi:hypothetical protein
MSETIDTVRSPTVIEVTGMTNAEFLEQYAAPGRVGLVGGPGFLERMIQRSQRRQLADRKSSDWAHAFLFQGRRADGHHWVLESDLEIFPERAQLGVPENRVSKYHDPGSFNTLAVLDFNVGDPVVQKMLARGLDLLADRTQYSLREIFALYWKLKSPSKREGENPLSREGAFFCSAFVQHLYLEAGIDFSPEVDTKLTTPEDIAQTSVPHVRYVLRHSPDAR